uniref:G-protein coupled receptors family 1 profile domain-containing protein n=1 Tax=Panagrolaimus sp. PS1159 TaxID=55785 RepID=A0AC35FX26_9BILA
MSSIFETTTVSDIIPIEPTTADIIIGILMIIVSLLCIIPNIIVINAIHSDKELKRLNAYRFMLYLAYIDIIQLFPHTITGFFNIYQTNFNPLLAKLLGAIATPSYVAYAVLTLILSLNRLTQLCFPNIDEKIFSKRGMRIWLLIGIGFFVIFSIALVSPIGTIRYYPEYWSWDYDNDYIASNIVQTVEMVIELGGIPISGMIYLIVFGVLIAKRKKYQVSKNYRAEMKILIQAVVITGYCSILNVFWHFYDVLLPATNYAYTGLNFMWIINCAVNPIIYIIVNAAIRKNTKIRASRSGGRIIVVTQHPMHKTKSTPFEDPATRCPTPLKSHKITQAPTNECSNKKIVFLT